MSQRLIKISLNPVFLWPAFFLLLVSAFVFAELPEFKISDSREGAFFFGTTGHFLGFALLSGVLYLALTTTAFLRLKGEKALVAAAVISASIAGLTEASQLLSSTRDFSLGDFWVDCLGVIIGITFAEFYAYTIPRERLQMMGALSVGIHLEILFLTIPGT